MGFTVRSQKVTSLAPEKGEWRARGRSGWHELTESTAVAFRRSPTRRRTGRQQKVGESKDRLEDAKDELRERI